MKVSLHELLDEVNLAELVNTGWFEHVEYGDDILMMEVSE